MKNSETNIRDIVHERNTLSVEIFDTEKNCIGNLSPVTVSMINNDEMIQKLTKWRNQARKYFLTQFSATPEKTKIWLENVVLKDYSRLMFIINSNTKPIGTYGFKGLNSDSAELDNLSRGEMGGHPQLIYYAEIALIRCLFETFKVGEVFAFVLSDNSMALDLHESIGFKLTERIPLQKTESEGEVHLSMGKSGCQSEDGLYVDKVELKPSDFAIAKES